MSGESGPGRRGKSGRTRRPIDAIPGWGRAMLVVVVLALAGVAWLKDQDLASLERDVVSAPSAGKPGAVAKTDWYELHFSTPKYPDVAADHRGGMDEALAGLIGRAARSVDVACYDFDLPNVADAMAAAKRRGVAVRFVTDSDTVANKDEAIQTALKRLRDAGVPIVEDRNDGIMHNKFTIVDGEWLATGSWNYTTGDTYRLNNWMGIFRSKELAARYQAEFDQLFAGKFAGAKAAAARTTALTIGGAKVETCFAPKGKCADLIVQTIEREASKSIRFLAFSFTHDDIGKAMTDKRRAGVSVSGVFETTGSQVASSEYGKMKAAGLDVYTDGNPYVMHHKVIVIDDRVTVAGSFNFSSNADKDNDENLLIVTDPGFAAAFAAEFERVLAVAKNPPAKASPAKK